MENTLAIIKPDGVERNLIGKIIQRIESDGFKIIALKMVHLRKQDAQGFYHVHKMRSFFDELTNYMSSGPVVIMALQRAGAISRWRELMGATNPSEAASGTIRKEFGVNLEKNTTHGSDGQETAAFEVSYFFNKMDIHA